MISVIVLNMHNSFHTRSSYGNGGRKLQISAEEIQTARVKKSEWKKEIETH